MERVRGRGVSWVSVADAKDANKRRPCQGKRCTIVWGVDGGARWSELHLQRLYARKGTGQHTNTRELSRLENVTKVATFTTPLPAHPAAPRSLTRTRYTYNGDAASSQPAIGHRRALDGRARILYHGSAGEGGRRPEHGHAQHAGRHRLQQAVKLSS